MTNQRYLCYGYRLDNKNKVNDQSGCCLLCDRKKNYYWIQIVEDLQQLSASSENKERFFIHYEWGKINKKGQFKRTGYSKSNAMDLTMAQKKFRQKLNERSYRHASLLSFSPTSYSPIDPSLDSIMETITELDNLDTKWKKSFAGISTKQPRTFQIRGKGLHLVKNARRWNTPYTRKHSAHSLVRGIQWRFVQAFAGFETIVLSHYRINSQKTTEKPSPFTAMFYTHKIQEKLETHLAQNTTVPLEKSLLNWSFEGLQQSSPNEWFIDFLSPNDTGKQTLHKFQKEGILADWKAGLSLATTLRNVTTHGALSPTQTIKQRLIPTYLALTALVIESSYVLAFMDDE